MRCCKINLTAKVKLCIMWIVALIIFALVFVVFLKPPKRDLDAMSNFFCYVSAVDALVQKWKGNKIGGTFDPQVPGNMVHVASMRERFNTSLRKFQKPDSYAVESSDVKIDGVNCALHVPSGAGKDGKAAKLPVHVIFHGGGYVVGCPDMWKSASRELVARLGIAVVVVDYRKSPEFKFPVPVNDCVTVTKWLTSPAASSLGLDCTRVVLCGDSAGGGLVVAVALSLKQTTPDAFKHIRGLVLMYPWLDLTMSCPSIYLYGEGYNLHTTRLMWYKQQYLGTSGELQLDVLASPYGATAQQLTGFPPTLVQTPEADPLRDEGERFADKLVSCGVTVEHKRYPRTIHGFTSLPVPGKRPAWEQWFTFVARSFDLTLSPLTPAK